jgi:hypothetical protein
MASQEALAHEVFGFGTPCVAAAAGGEPVFGAELRRFTE